MSAGLGVIDILETLYVHINIFKHKNIRETHGVSASGSIGDLAAARSSVVTAQAHRLLTSERCMSLPRPVIAGETIMITGRCTQRQFLLPPSSAVNGIIGYCLAVAAERYGLRLHAFCAMSNGSGSLSEQIGS